MVHPRRQTDPSASYSYDGLSSPRRAPQRSAGCECCRTRRRVWPSFDRDLETEYAKSMLGYRLRTTLLYGFFYVTFMLCKTVQTMFRPHAVFLAQLGLTVAFLLTCTPLLGLCSRRLGLPMAFSRCVQRPHVIRAIGFFQFAFFLASLLLDTVVVQGWRSTTLHLSLLWLMTMVGASSIFDFWSFLALFLGMNISLFALVPEMEKESWYFLYAGGSSAVVLVTLQHDLLVRKLFLKGKGESQFLARMSHEIRTPMNGVLGFLTELKRTVLSPVQLTYVSGMSVAAETLSQVTDDILDHLKQRSGKMALNWKPECVRTVVSDCVTLFQGRAAQKGLALCWSCAEGVPHWARLDRLRVTQMLGNLINNALKFTDAGSVDVRVRVTGTVGRRVQLTVEVQDTGIGVPVPQQGRLFRAFNQADESITRKFGGTGLGLALVKGLAELMGGTAGCTSPGEGAGSTFWFTLETQETPVPRDSWSTSLDHDAPCPQDLQIMVVDDTRLNLELMKTMIARWGCHGTYFASGPDALAFVRAAGPRDLPNLTFMDFHMPEMDGCETTARLLQLRPGLPVVGLTADITPQCRERALKSGMLEVLAKPYQEKRLIEACRTYATQPPEEPEAPGVADPTGGVHSRLEVMLSTTSMLSLG